MAYTSKQAAQEAQHNETSVNKIAAPAFVDQRTSTGVQLKQQQLMQAAVQRMGAEEEEPLQGKFVAQRAEEEELLQGKFATTQLAEDEELLQGKFATTQLAEDEELLQGKFETAQLAEEEELLQGKFSNTATAQLEEKPNNTGLPNQLKAGIESLSGMSMDGVKVHYNSDKPAQLNAHAYAQGSDIHVAPGQEQHLPHEAWHVVQQAQGRVKPTMQMKAGVPVNDDVGLETEADVMGAKALQAASIAQLRRNETSSPQQNASIQKMKIKERDALKSTDYGDCKFNTVTKSGIYLFTIWHGSDKYYNIQIHWHPQSGALAEWWSVRWANEPAGNQDALDWMKELVRATPKGVAVALASQSSGGAEYSAQFPALPSSS